VTITEILTRRCPRSKKSPCGNIHKYISKPWQTLYLCVHSDNKYRLNNKHNRMMIQTAPKLQQPEYNEFKNIYKIWPEEFHWCIL
jgi:hypothetical protein